MGSLVVRGNQAACSWGQGRELNAAAGCGFPIGVKKGRRGRGKEEAESGAGAVVVVSGESDAGRGRREEPRKESLGIWGFFVFVSSSRSPVVVVRASREAAVNRAGPGERDGDVRARWTGSTVAGGKLGSGSRFVSVE
jgi:hypothetical protein